MDTQTNSIEATPSKKRMPRWLLITIVEIAMVLGCVLALFLVPANTPLKTFLIICGCAFVLGNAMLFLQLRKPVDPNRKVDSSRLWLAGVFGLLAIIWQLYERYGR